MVECEEYGLEVQVAILCNTMTQAKLAQSFYPKILHFAYMKHIGVYRYTSAYTGIPSVKRCGGIPEYQVPNLRIFFMDFSKFTTNFGRFRNFFTDSHQF